MNGRLAQIRMALGMTQKEMATVLGISQPTYCQFETGARPLQVHYIKTLAAKYGVNEDWIVNGTGEMFIKSSQEDEFLEVFNGLTEKSKEIILQLMIQMKKEED